ncbi:hypothetical protein J5TS2_39110 [Brevibacillus halotolerans]|uniref:hypothetical protein n=1 Tax=Brevibacillus halotolerans TaxID=1507437 RepID=UPI001B07C918|nr:hypothetical protein [Brevibacillus halotolerans]GIO03243.1 hypothetical protein J5TS2_39110 [Brevibacillus halotolerans]
MIGGRSIKRATVIIDKKTKQLVSADVKLQVSKIDQATLNKAIHSHKEFDPKIIQKAAQEIKAFTDKTLKTTKATRVQSEEENVWVIEGIDGPGGILSATLGVQTGKLW